VSVDASAVFVLIFALSVDIATSAITAPPILREALSTTFAVGCSKKPSR
jgi:hypothetical protein